MNALPTKRTRILFQASFWRWSLALTDHIKELLYTIGDSMTKAHLGRSVIEEEWSDSFDYMSDERIRELSQHSGAKDYVFCSHCERKLGQYLESPWYDHIFKGRRITPDIAYYFWVSILWRISFFEGVNFRIPSHLEEDFRKMLWNYFREKDLSSPSALQVKEPLFHYKVLCCKDFCKNYAGVIYYEYDKNGCASLLLGDVAACFSFAPDYSFNGLSFYGLEKAFQEAPVNDGSQQEAFVSIEAQTIDNAVMNIFQALQKVRQEADVEKIMNTWEALRKRLPVLPERPSQSFIRFVIDLLYSESTKIGEAITPEYYASCFKNGLVLFSRDYFIF